MKYLRTFESLYDVKEFKGIKVGDTLKGIHGFFQGQTGKIIAIALHKGVHGGATIHAHFPTDGPIAAVVYNRIENGEFEVI